MSGDAAKGGLERARLDEALGKRLSVETRAAIWGSVDEILVHGPMALAGRQGHTGLALGFVQSGKTTTITALVAAAADEGYQLVIALLGSTNLLLDQNADRLSAALGVGERSDYVWVVAPNPSGRAKAREFTDFLGRGRRILVPVLKHAGRLDQLRALLESAGVLEVPALIIDDEADQASLNTAQAQRAESRTYEAITGLRAAVPRHLYVQFTATPYAPLLQEAEDHLRPDFVALLQPGPGYTGGREFFVDKADVVVRPIPAVDEQRSKTAPTALPTSLVSAFGSFVAGTALLLGNASAAAPVSMLVHSTQRNDVQSRYHFLLQRLKKNWTSAAAGATSATDLPAEIRNERDRVVVAGAADLTDAEFLDQVRYVLSECTMWLVNSVSDVKKIDWRVAPVHVLVGGNKLDRGFTVEGLTVTYMNRPASDQIDTLEQRARAFGYRGDLLPYCQFFATPRTLKVLREVVDTEYDLRARLRDHLESGGDLSDWAKEIGLLLPQGTRPSRESVLGALARFNAGPAWHQLRRPLLDAMSRTHNDGLIRSIGLADAPRLDYGRLSHPTMHLSLARLLDEVLRPWAAGPVGSSPGWRGEDLFDLLSRIPDQHAGVPIIYMRLDDGAPRTRDWDPETGFVNLFQGPDARGPYPGDRMIGGVATDAEKVVIQVHLVTSKVPGQVPSLHTIAVHAGRRAADQKGMT